MNREVHDPWAHGSLAGLIYVKLKMVEAPKLPPPPPPQIKETKKTYILLMIMIRSIVLTILK